MQKRVLSWFLALVLYILITITGALRRGNIKTRWLEIYYNLGLFFNILKNFVNKIKIWLDVYNSNSLNVYLELNDLKDFKKLKDRNKEGLDLLVMLINERAAIDQK